MGDYADVGSKRWLSEQADKLIDFGLGVLGTKLIGKDTYSSMGGDSTKSVQPTSTRWMPYAIGGVVAVAIVVLLAKR